MKILCTISLLFAICSFCKAQVIIKNDKGEIKSSIDIFEENNIIQKQVAQLSIHSGSNNLVNFKQIGVNEISSQISGDYNNLFVLQYGSGNAIDITQDGNRNSIISDNYSSGTRVANIQIGDNNSINQNIVGSDNSKFIVIQNGHDLKLDHNVHGQVGSGIEVKMMGKDMEILIESNQ